MKKIRITRIIAGTLTAAALFAAVPAGAEPVSPEEALSLALGAAPQKVRGKKASFRLVKADSVANLPTVYLFSREGAEGFLLASADDRATPLLGYSAEGNLTATDGSLAPSMEYWMDFLSRRIGEARKSEGRREIPKKSRPYREPIYPLVSTHWNQDMPYNYYCPKKNQQETYTGCVATSMAQVLKYHNWPEDHGEGSIGYNWDGRTLQVNFAKMNFKWDQMLDSYEGSYTNDQRNAVAQLMLACGYSVQMNYGTSGSGAISARVANALGKYFRYDKQLHYYQRSCYQLIDWENLIYETLQKDGPVIYDGQSYQGGHSFVCDGYDKDGYFHINWGWGGVSDGYFLLDALDPYQQGIGGSLSNSGFDFSQGAVVGIRPDRTGNSQWTEALYTDGLYLTLQNDGTIMENGAIYNMGPADFTNPVIGLRFTSADGEKYYSFARADEILLLQYFQSVDFTVPADMPAGRYTVDGVYGKLNAEGGIDEEDLKDLPCSVCAADEWIYDSSSSTPTLVRVEPAYPVFSDYSFPSKVSFADPFKVSGTLTSTDDKPWFSELTVLFANTQFTDVNAVSLNYALDVPAGGSVPFNVETTIAAAAQGFTGGECLACLAAETFDGYIPLHEPVSVIVGTTSGVSDIAAEAPSQSDAREYFTLTGVRVASAEAGEPDPALPAGIYVVKGGGKTAKIVISE